MVTNLSDPLVVGLESVLSGTELGVREVNTAAALVAGYRGIVKDARIRASDMTDIYGGIIEPSAIGARHYSAVGLVNAATRAFVEGVVPPGLLYSGHDMWWDIVKQPEYTLGGIAKRRFERFVPKLIDKYADKDSLELVVLGIGTGDEIKSVLEYYQLPECPMRGKKLRIVVVDQNKVGMDKAISDLGELDENIEIIAVHADFTDSAMVKDTLGQIEVSKGTRARLVLFKGLTLGNIDDLETVTSGVLRSGDGIYLDSAVYEGDEAPDLEKIAQGYSSEMDVKFYTGNFYKLLTAIGIPPEEIAAAHSTSYHFESGKLDNSLDSYRLAARYRVSENIKSRASGILRISEDSFKSDIVLQPVRVRGNNAFLTEVMGRHDVKDGKAECGVGSIYAQRQK